MANIPSIAWNEASPSGSQVKGLGDNRIRELKSQLREVIAIDHEMSSSGQGSDWGKHNQVNLIEQADLGTGATGYCILGAQTVLGKPELVFTDEDNNDIQITSGGAIPLGSAFRSGDLLISSNINTPAGFTDVSVTYADKFIRISDGTPLNTGTLPVKDHTHSTPAHTHSFLGHTHGLSELTTVDGGDGSDSHTPSGTDSATPNITSSGSGTSGSTGDGTPAYIQVKVYQKD